MKYIKELRDWLKTQPVFSLRDLKTRFRKKGLKPPYANTLVRHLRQKGEIVRLARGTYSGEANLDLVGHAIRPSYHGLQDALSIHGLWQQQAIVVLLTPRHVRTGSRSILDNRVRIRRIRRSFFFGFDLRTHHGTRIWVSDIEKTLLDFAYYREPLDTHTLKRMQAKIDYEKLSDYLKKSPVYVQKKVRQLLGTKKSD